MLCTGAASHNIDEDYTSSSDSDVDASLELKHTHSNGDTIVEIDGVEYVAKNFQGDPTDVEGTNPECVKNFRTISAGAMKGLFKCFDQTGAFIAVCKHGMLILYCDMIKSGEL
jgi:hypothetical protein